MSLITAIQSGDLEQVKRLLETDPSLLTTSESSPILIAIYYGERAIADYLLAQGTPLNLFEASAAGKPDRVRELLVLNPASANEVAPDGFQPLGLAAFFGHTAAAALLIDAGADVNSPSKNGQKVQPLHSAVAGQHFELAQRLLEHGANVNAVQEGGFTPLHGAADNGQIEMIELLLKQGADLTARTHDGLTALDIARQHGHEAASARLIPADSASTD